MVPYRKIGNASTRERLPDSGCITQSNAMAAQNTKLRHILPVINETPGPVTARRT